MESENQANLILDYCESYFEIIKKDYSSFTYQKKKKTTAFVKEKQIYKTSFLFLSWKVRVKLAKHCFEIMETCINNFSLILLL